MSNQSTSLLTEDNEDPIGFTRQTAMLLAGVGAETLIPRFRKKNISTEAMARLTEEDLKLLGADQELLQRMLKELRVIGRGILRNAQTPQQRLDQLIEILRHSKQQLSLIEAFVAYARLRLDRERFDSFIEPDKNLRASRALRLAAEATLAETEDTELALKELVTIFSRECDGPTFLNITMPTKNSMKRNAVYLFTFGGIGFITFVLSRTYGSAM